MKRTVWCMVICMTFTFAQAQSGPGIKGGLSMAAQTFGADDGEFKTDIRMAAHFGGFYQFSLSKKFSLQPELLYSGQGGREEQSYLDMATHKTGSYMQTYRFNYLVAPLMLKFHVTKYFSLEAGPQPGLLLNAKQKDKFRKVPLEKEFYRSLDLGLNGGVTFNLPSGLHMGARYCHGMINIRNENFFDHELRNSMLQISIGYSFK